MNQQEELEAVRRRSKELDEKWNRVDAKVRAAVTYYWTEIDGQRVRVACYPAPHEVVAEEENEK